MKNKILKIILICGALALIPNVYAEEAPVTPGEKCEQMMDQCSAKCDEIADDAKRDACLEKCEIAYNKCYEEAESK